MENQESKEVIEKKEMKGADKEVFSKGVTILIVAVAVMLLYNQYMVSSLGVTGSATSVVISDITQIKSTGQAIAVLFPVEEIQTDQDAITMMISQGTPEYGGAMGVSFDDPAGSMNSLAAAYKTVKADLQKNSPEIWDRYLSLATKPVGISCEFCCGVGPIGITKKGDLTCGCKHNPAIQSLTMLLMKDTDYSDAEVLREAMRWKSLWFPRDMVGLAMKTAGGDLESDLPGMVGGC